MAAEMKPLCASHDGDSIIESAVLGSIAYCVTLRAPRVVTIVRTCGYICSRSDSSGTWKTPSHLASRWLIKCRHGLCCTWLVEGVEPRMGPPWWRGGSDDGQQAQADGDD